METLTSAAYYGTEKKFSKSQAIGGAGSMARRKAQTLTEVELEFMQVVWDLGEVSTDDVQRVLRGKGRPLADGSIRKVLTILEKKGYLSRRREGHAFIHRPKVPREQANRRLVQDLARRAFSGSAALMVASLVEGNTVSQTELDEIKRLIAQCEKEGDDD